MRIVLISFSKIADDPRVRRQGDALASAGHDVSAVGLAGARGAPPKWPISSVDDQVGRPWWRRARLALSVASARLMSSRAEKAYWSLGIHRRFLSEAKGVAADVYVANDWRALPVAARAAEASNGRYVFDSHEYGVEESIDRRAWRWLFPPYIRSIEQRFVPGATLVSTVAGGIGDLLQRDYGLAVCPTVIRNVPAYQTMPLRAPATPFVVLYHGAFYGDRGLEELIDSVGQWSSDFRLVVRGFGAATYERKLRDRAASALGAERIEFVPPVPMSDLVAHANAADIGIHPIPARTNQTRFCLPNKFFEYVMAGLALCVSDAPEMAALLRQYDLGELILEPTASGIAAAVSRFDAASIERFKRNAADAARELSWDRERQRLLDAYERVGLR